MSSNTEIREDIYNNRVRWSRYDYKERENNYERIEDTWLKEDICNNTYNMAPSTRIYYWKIGINILYNTKFTCVRVKNTPKSL